MCIRDSVFVDEARRRVVGGIEAVERGQVAERQRQRAAARAQAGGQRVLQGPGAAQLVAVDQGAEHHALARHAGVEMPDARGIRVAHALGRQIRTGEKEGTRTGRGRGRGPVSYTQLSI